MLRRIASRTLREPVIARPTSPGPQPTTTSAAVLSYQYQLLQQSRGLVSSVLLGSTRDAYESKKMAELKAELKSRGLAYSGRKEDLIKRLVDHDSYINGSTANMDAAPGARPQLRKKSTLASLRNNDKEGAQKKEPAPPVPTSQSGHATIKGKPLTTDGGDNKGPIIDNATAKAVAEASKPLGSMKESETPKNLEPGTVHNAAADGLAEDTTAKASPSQAEEGPAKRTTPPGLPPHKAPAAKETFNVQIPYYPDPPVPGAKIPVVTSYTSPHLRQSEEMEPESSPFVPKAISVSASSAISHASDMADHADSSKDEEAENKPKGILGEILADLQAANGGSAEKKAESALENVSKGVGAAKSAFNSVAEQAKGAFSSASSGSDKKGESSSFSSSGSSSTNSGSGSKKKNNNRPLNEQERTGAYVLAGIVTGGFLLGGLGQPSKSKKSHKESSDKNDSTGMADKEGQVKVAKVVPVAAVPKGDQARRAEEVKPSGGAVVAPAGSKTLAPIMCVPKGAQLNSAGAGSMIANEASETLKRLAYLSTCEVSDAMLKLKLKEGGYLPGIEMYSPTHISSPDVRICGPAYTVKFVAQTDVSAPKAKEHFVDGAEGYAGHVMVISAPSLTRSAVWGGLMTARAQHLQLKGVVVDGRCRDLSEHREAEFAVFARGHSIQGQSPFTRASEINVPLVISDPSNEGKVWEEKRNPRWPNVTVRPGDYVLADLDGVIVVPPERAEEVVGLAEKGRREDDKCMEDIKNGMPIKEAFAKNRT